MDDKMRRWASYGSLFVVGAAAGAALGLLLAPDSGPETRRKLRQWLKDKRAKSAGEYEAVREAMAAGRKAFQQRHKETAGV